MRIKHKETGNETIVTISEWTSEYLRKGKYHLWEIVDFNNIVKFYRILENGKTKKMLMDLSSAKQTVNKNPKEFSYKQETITEQDYKEYLNLIIKKNHFPLRKSNWYNLPIIKKRLESIINSTISREIWVVIRGVTILIIAYSIWKIYGHYV